MSYVCRLSLFWTGDDCLLKVRLCMEDWVSTQWILTLIGLEIQNINEILHFLLLRFILSSNEKYVLPFLLSTKRNENEISLLVFILRIKVSGNKTANKSYSWYVSIKNHSLHPNHTLGDNYVV